MSKTIFITHANIQMDENIPVPDWHLSEVGLARHKEFNSNSITANVKTIFTSNEQKAIDGAQVLSSHLDIQPQIVNELHENDRSATGFLPPYEFEKTADLFFKNSEESIRGWEKAIDAQSRIVKCVTSIIQANKHKGDIAIVAHGGVGTLLLCKLLGFHIDRKHDQPPNGGGNYFVINSDDLIVDHGWKSIDE